MRVLIVTASFYQEITKAMLLGASQLLEAKNIVYDHIDVPGALEIPGCIKRVNDNSPYDAYVALGCVIRGETYHFEVVCNESARGLMDLTIREGIAIGNGILTCENRKQAEYRADPAQGNKGAGAVEAALVLANVTGEGGGG